jgi:hypothetical protein
MSRILAFFQAFLAALKHPQVGTFHLINSGKQCLGGSISYGLKQVTAMSTLED